MPSSANHEPWVSPAAAVLEAQSVDPARGLDDSEVARRRERYGPNQLRTANRRSALAILVRQFASLIMALLAVAAAIALVMGDFVEAVAILVVVIINAALGFVTELKAVRSMEALRRLGHTKARVRRAGEIREIAAADLVPGDIVLVEGGDMLSADVRLIDASGLQADESALTGESAPVDKDAEPVARETPLAERRSMLYKGTAVTRGTGAGVIVGTGLETELGDITELVEATESTATPLEQRLDRLAHRLVWVTLGVAVLVAVAGIVTGRELGLTMQTAIALAVAAIPEGLPVVATIALARGMWRMVKRNAFINRLSAVETLGATSVICTDKTGTLTENEMAVEHFELVEGEEAKREALEIGVLCNDVEGGHGDPMERALLAAGAAGGIEREALLSKQPRVREVAFDPETRMMATFHRAEDGLRIAVKGAPEAVLAACGLDETATKQWLGRNDALAVEGLRLLGLASGRAQDADVEPYRNLTFVGLVALRDPPRKDVRDAIERCRAAGIRVVMVTGDQRNTAAAIAKAVGVADEKTAEALPGSAIKPHDELSDAQRAKLLEVKVFARVSPREKLNLIDLHQRSGAVVAMTGDGVNDAPALKKADIGIAMGQRGTEVAREAAAMVLKDDAFGTIVAAVEQGRVIFNNIRRFVIYLLSCNASEVLVVGLASLAAVPLPLLPLQILFLNLVTDVFPALALGVGQGDPQVMSRTPRPASEAIVERRHWVRIAGYGVVITASTLSAFAVALLALQLAPRDAVTVSFLTLALAQLWHVFNMRDPDAGLLKNDVVHNRWVWGALALCVGLLAAAIYVPLLSQTLQLAPPGAAAWVVIVGFSLVPLAAGQLWLAGQARRSSAHRSIP